jgi:hypothetical protein
VEQPCGYVEKGHEQMVYKLKKALMDSYSRIESYFMKKGFE